jgi:translation elongation factor EF-4
VEAQTLANVITRSTGHEIVPVLNKIDLPAAERTKSHRSRTSSVLTPPMPS